MARATDPCDVLTSPCCGSRLVDQPASLRCEACGSDYPARQGFVDFVGREVPPPGLIQALWQSPAVVSVYRAVRRSIQAGVAGRVTDEATEGVLLRNFLDPRPGDDILDLGCGDGRHVRDVLETTRTGRLFAVDVSAQMLARFGKDLSPALRDRVTLARAMADRLPLADAVVDRAFAIAMLHLVLDPMPALREVRRVLKPGGVVVFTVFMRGAITDLPPVVALMRSVLGVRFESVAGVGRMCIDAGFLPPEVAVVHPLAIVRASVRRG